MPDEYSSKPQVFWMPAKHNDKTQEALKKTSDSYQEKIAKFKEDC